MGQASERELDRQFRVLRQTISMHGMLRDQYRRLGVCVDLLLLAASVIFCASTFACDYISKRLGMSEGVLADILGVASIAAFFAALAGMVLGWKGKAARHGEAVKALSAVLAAFREARGDDGWPTGEMSALSKAYWDAANNVVPIPDRRFTSLKARHLRKVEVSRMSDSVPGCPVSLIRIVVLCRSVFKLCRRSSRMSAEGGGDGSGGSDRPGGEVRECQGDGDPPRVRRRD